MVSGLITGFMLDRQWHVMTTGADHTKRAALLALGRLLAAERVPYAVIGGVALQVHQPDPRTTLDIEIAVLDLASVPRAALQRAGFEPRGENWAFADGTPVQFTDDPALAAAVREADEITFEDVPLRVITVAHLLHEKLRSGSDPARRRSKRLQDLADAQSLLENDPALDDELSVEERAILDQLPR
jgi:hypothetical protein